jgi:hypothetical protein
MNKINTKLNVANSLFPNNGARKASWRINNISSFDLQAYGSVVAFPLEYPPRLINPWNKWIATLN